VHFLHLDVGELRNEVLEVFVGPRVVIFVVSEQLLELVVFDVLVLPRRVHASAQGCAELHGRTSGRDSGVGMPALVYQQLRPE